MEGESSVTRNIVEELHSWYIQVDEMEAGSGVTPSIIDELHSCDIQGDQMEGDSVVLLEVSSMNLILGMSKEIKWKVEAWCYSQYH